MHIDLHLNEKLIEKAACCTCWRTKAD